MTTSVCVPAQSSTCACVGGSLMLLKSVCLAAKGPCLMQVCVCACVCVTALHALDLQLANKALGPHSCLIVSVHRDPLTHTLTLRHTQCERLSHSNTDTHRHTQTYTETLTPSCRLLIKPV